MQASTNFNFSTAFWIALALVILGFLFRDGLSAYLKREPVTK